MKIGIIGSGNVATHLALAFHEYGISISFVFSRKMKNAVDLANRIGATPIDKLSNLNKKVDLLIIAVKDDVIEKVADAIPLSFSRNKHIFHTSGSVPSTALAKHPHFGVFYPLQTFSKDKELDLQQVPFCIHGNDSKTIQLGLKLAKKLSQTVYTIDDEQRKYLHVAAVFANNFVNHLNGSALEICRENNIPVSLLFPLMKETLNKALLTDPFSVQTGPAKRNDEQVMKNHETLLEDSPEKEILYKLISKLIIQSSKELEK